MNQSEQQRLLRGLLCGAPTAAHQWIEEARFSKELALSDNWWLGLAEGAANKARLESSHEWALVSTTAYEMLAERAAPDSKDTYLLSTMMLRAYLISNLGAAKNDPVLDVDKIVDWFKLGLSISVQAVAQQASSWTEQSTDTIHELRKIKNRLSVVKYLVDKRVLSPDKDLTAWLTLRESLP